MIVRAVLSSEPQMNLTDSGGRLLRSSRDAYPVERVECEGGAAEINCTCSFASFVYIGP